jgi:hypothetical protein
MRSVFQEHVMRKVRTFLGRMLGYTLERTETYNQDGLPTLIRFEVRCPHTGFVISSSPTLAAARQCVIGRELSLAPIAQNDAPASPGIRAA